MIGWGAGNNSYSMSRVGVLLQHWAGVRGQLCLHLVTKVGVLEGEQSGCFLRKKTLLQLQRARAD